jgi:hypothetical protein
MKFKFRVNNGVWVAPKSEFLGHWALWLYVRDMYGDTIISAFEHEEIKPELLQEQAL